MVGGPGQGPPAPCPRGGDRNLGLRRRDAGSWKRFKSRQGETAGLHAGEQDRQPRLRLHVLRPARRSGARRRRWLQPAPHRAGRERRRRADAARLAVPCSTARSSSAARPSLRAGASPASSLSRRRSRLLVDLDLPVLVSDWLLGDVTRRSSPRAAGQCRGLGRAAGSWLTVNGRSPPQPITAEPGARIRLQARPMPATPGSCGCASTAW